MLCQDGGEARGAVVGVHDPPMGWSAYGQTMTLPWLNADAVALAATQEAAELAAAMAAAHLAEPDVRAAELLTRQARYLVITLSLCRRAAHAGLQPAVYGVAAASTRHRLQPLTHTVAGAAAGARRGAACRRVGARVAQQVLLSGRLARLAGLPSVRGCSRRTSSVMPRSKTRFASIALVCVPLGTPRPWA